MSEQLSLDGLDGRDTRIETYLGRCLCSPCWCARCVRCREVITKHNFTEQDAHDDAVDALERVSQFQHHCKAAP